MGSRACFRNRRALLNVVRRLHDLDELREKKRSGSLVQTLQLLEQNTIIRMEPSWLYVYPKKTTTT
jgi:hypothetical protein